MSRKYIHIFLQITLVAMMTGIVSCSPEWKDEMTPGISVTGQYGERFEDREINTDTRKVLLLYSAGFPARGGLTMLSLSIPIFPYQEDNTQPEPARYCSVFIQQLTERQSEIPSQSTILKRYQHQQISCMTSCHM